MHQVPTRTRITINISGEIFETYEDTLARFPTTLLGDKRRRRKHYCIQTQQYFFERNRLCFESILHFYQSNGTLSCPVGISITLFEQECNFFRLPKAFVNDMKRKEGIFTQFLEENKKVVKHLPFRSRVWNILENPDTSQAAWYYGITSLFFVVVSIVTAAMETLPAFHSHPKVWAIMELALNVWFLAEILLRIAFSKTISSFFKSCMNVVDVLAIIPYFLLLIQNSDILNSNSTDDLVGFLQTLKFLRVCRLFRFSKHSKRLAVTGKILKACWRHFRLLLLCWFILITMGSTFMFVVEAKYVLDHHFNSIPQSLWWGVQTITSVGYGDCIPETLIGRLFACMYMLFGAATISLPILTIVNQFVRLYPKNVEMEFNAGKEFVGGADENDTTIHLLRSVIPIRRPSPNRYQPPM